ncbi:MAG: flavoprotein [Haloechinothrix sp.]
MAALEAISGHQVRSTYRAPGDESFPPADAVVVAPATYNTINKWAAGISDTYALNMLAELTGLGVPIAVLPFVNTALTANRVFARSVSELRESDVRVLYGDDGFQPHPPRTGETVLDRYPLRLALDALEK